MHLRASLISISHSFRDVSVLPRISTVWAMCAEHGLRMDDTGVLALTVKLRVMIGCAQSFIWVWVNLFCAQTNLREMV